MGGHAAVAALHPEPLACPGRHAARGRTHGLWPVPSLARVAQGAERDLLAGIVRRGGLPGRGRGSARLLPGVQRGRLAATPTPPAAVMALQRSTAAFNRASASS